MEYKNEMKKVEYGDVIFRKKDKVLYHYGIYENDKSVIHYQPKNGSKAKVVQTTMDEFINGENKFWITKFYHNNDFFTPKETIERAKKRLNENKYNVVFNNCESFAIWCKTGLQYSRQINNSISLGIFIVSTIFLKFSNSPTILRYRITDLINCAYIGRR